MIIRYVWADLIRNPRRTLSTMVGVMFGVGLTCAILFFVDGLSASMTQAAVAPLPIDMQVVLSPPVADAMSLTLHVAPGGPAKPDDVIQVRMELVNRGENPANEVIVRSVPDAGLAYVAGSARVNGQVVSRSGEAAGENPLAAGPAKAGLNIGVVEPGATVSLEYQVMVDAARDITADAFAATFSTREVLTPVAANAPKPLSQTDLAAKIRALDGVAFAEQLSFADLPVGALSAGTPVDGPVRVFGFDPSYTARDATIKLVKGAHVSGEALLSAEAAAALAVDAGDSIALDLPDGSQFATRVSGIVDLTQARSLFASRQGADLETFIYVPNAVVVDTAFFSEVVLPAFQRAMTRRGERVKSPPLREIDLGVERELLDAEPSVALGQTQYIGAAVSAVVSRQDFLLDNISNTLAVARDDAVVAKRMFVFLGIPGAILAATLAAYAGVVLSGAQRREQAILRIRGASRRHLLAMLALRVSYITAGGAVVGVVFGFVSVAAVVGYRTLMRATPGSLLTSAVLGAGAGLLATGAALYLTGRWFIEREINEDRARLALQPPAWRRYRLDLAGLAAVLIATAIVIKTAGFEGSPGSVYVGRAVQLPLHLLFLPIAAWIAGSFFGGRLFAWLLARSGRNPAAYLNRPLALLYRMTLKRRAWSLAEAAVILGMIVALGTSLAVFTASYNGAKAADARYIVGSDLKITPSPANKRLYNAATAAPFAVEGIEAVTPVVYGVHNVILRSHRTSDVATMAALDPETYARVAPLDDAHFSSGSAGSALGLLAAKPDAVLLSADMAAFLQAQVGDPLWVLLARGTAEQVEIEMEVAGLFERLPGFPDGADALMHINRHAASVASTAPAFYLAQTRDPSDAALERMANTLRSNPGAGAAYQVDTRLTALAKDQSSLAALNINGLLKIDSGYALVMGTVAIAIFVFGLLLQRRREYVTLRAQGLQPRAIRTLIGAEASTAAAAGCVVGVPVGLVMAFYLINVLRPLFVLDPPYLVPLGSLSTVVLSVLAATVVTSVVASSLVNQLRAIELLRDE